MKDSDLGLKCLKVHSWASGTNIFAAFTQICFPVSQRTHTHTHTFSFLTVWSAVYGHVYLKTTHALYVLIPPPPNLPYAILQPKLWPLASLCSFHISGKTVLKGSDKWDPFFKYSTVFFFWPGPTYTIVASAGVLNLAPNVVTGET